MSGSATEGTFIGQILTRAAITWALGLFTLVYLYLIWSGEYFPSQDGPSHLYNTWALMQLDTVSVFGRFYQADWSLIPNWLGTALLFVFMSAMSAVAAQKLLISIIIVVFVLGFARMSRGDSAQLSPSALLGPMIIIGFPLYMGFFSFCLGLAMVPWVWAIAYKARRKSQPLDPWIMGALLVLGFLAHVLALGAMLMGLFVMMLTPGKRATRKWRAIMLLASIPALCLLAWYLLSFSGSESQRWSLARLLDYLLAMEVVNGVDEMGKLLGVPIMLLVLIRLFMAQTTADFTPWLILAVTAFCVYLLLPNGSTGHWFLSSRMSLFVWLALIPLMTPRGEVIQIGMYLVFLCMLTMNFGQTTELLDKKVQQYVELGRTIEDGSVILPLDFNPEAAPLRDGRFFRFRPFQHAAGYIGINQNIIDISNYEAQTDHFQVRLKKNVSAPNYNQLTAHPGKVDLARFAPVVRYVLVRYLKSAPPSFVRLLKKHYRRIDGNAEGELYERRK